VKCSERSVTGSVQKSIRFYSHDHHIDRAEVFGNWILEVFLRFYWYEVTGEWRKLHNEELNDMYC